MSKVGLYWRLLQGVVENPRYYYFVLRRSAYDKTVRQLANNNLPEKGTFYPVKLDLQVIEGVVKELVPHGLRYVDLEGGETFLYPQIIELLRMLKRHRLFVKPVT